MAPAEELERDLLTDRHLGLLIIFQPQEKGGFRLKRQFLHLYGARNIRQLLYKIDEDFPLQIPREKRSHFCKELLHFLCPGAPSCCSCGDTKHLGKHLTQGLPAGCLTELSFMGNQLAVSPGSNFIQREGKLEFGGVRKIAANENAIAAVV